MRRITFGGFGNRRQNRPHTAGRRPCGLILPVLFLPTDMLMFEGFEGKLTSSKWAQMTKCSQDTALRDILELVKKGIFVRGSGGGRSTNYLLQA
jgi:hypothetical protein